MSFWDEKEAKRLFQKLPFYNVPIEKPCIDLLHGLPFYDELSIVKISQAFKKYARSYRIEIIDSKDPLVQLEASKYNIKDLFKDLLDEIKGFKYQVTVKVLLSKHKENGDIEFAPVYFNSITKTVLNLEYDLDKSFQEIMYGIDNWINEGSGRIIESVDAEYVNISIFSPLSGNTYIELSHRLRNSVKGLINIKSNDSKCFLWCHIRHLNPLKIHPERITKADKNIVNDLDYKGIEFLVSEKDFGKIEKRNNICSNLFCHENNLAYLVYVSDRGFRDCMDL